MNRYVADFHVHTALSPCCRNEMTPAAIIDTAVKKGVNLLAVSDHNAGNNILVTERLAKSAGIGFLYSLELHVSESFHVLTLFDDYTGYTRWLKIVEQRRSKQPLEPESGRAQQVFDESGSICGEITERLNLDSSIPVREAIAAVHELGGMCIASHIDRPHDSVWLAYDGRIPDDLLFDALEISAETDICEADVKFPGLRQRYPFVTNSDAHSLKQFSDGPKNILMMNSVSIAELQLAFADRAGRSLAFVEEEAEGKC